MAGFMYRVGDFVYFETSSSGPYQIRRIEELNKTQNGNVEAKVMCFYRRRDISTSLINSVDKHHNILEDEDDDDSEEDNAKEIAGCGASRRRAESLSDEQKHQLRHRELFLSRQVETLPATHIRGKCAVTLLNETELLSTYLDTDDMFFYSLVYDPSQKTLLADRGEIRVGSKYQASVPKTCLENPEKDDDRDLSDLECLVWKPDNELEDTDVDKFLIIARSVGTFARALDSTSSVRQPSLHLSAAAASRDVTLSHALDTLHSSEYNLTEALQRLVPSAGPVLCRDEMEQWSASEANLFEEALDKYSKNFCDVRQDYLPWKSMKNIVEYYYMWKTTDRYVQQKRLKAAEAESKLKQVYIPSYNKPNPALLLGRAAESGPSTRSCEGCATTESSQWYGWGAPHTSTRLCSQCWSYWKRFGGLPSSNKVVESGERPAPGQRHERTALLQQSQRLHKCHITGCEKEFRTKSHLMRHLSQVHEVVLRSNSPAPSSQIMKTRAAFCLLTTAITRLSRRMCEDLLQPRRAARAPFRPVNVSLIKSTCQERLSEKNTVEVRKRGIISTEPTLAKLGVDTSLKPALLENPTSQTSAVTLAFPRPKETFLLPSELRGSQGPSIMRKRAYEQPTTNGITGPELKKPNIMGDARPINSVAGNGVRNGTNGSHDSADDLFFLINLRYKKMRKQVGVNQIRKAARKSTHSLTRAKTLTMKKSVAGGKTSDVVILE